MMRFNKKKAGIAPGLLRSPDAAQREAVRC
jgi:hypothetical protein